MLTRPKSRTKLRFSFLLISMLTLFGCGGSDSNSDTSSDTGNEVVEPDPSYQLSVDVSGLVGTLTMQLTAGSVSDKVSATADGRINFSSVVVPVQSSYSVDIAEQPVGQRCSLSENSSGTLASETLIAITATCDTLPTAANLSLSYGLKQFKFSWNAVAGATHYQLYENADGHSGFTEIASDMTTTSYDLNVVLYNNVNAQYLVAACNDSGDCADSNTVTVSDNLVEAIGHFKASDVSDVEHFGDAVAISGDGKTIVIGAYGVDLSSSNYDAGAAYVFVFDNNQWHQQAFLKASTVNSLAHFGSSVAISDDGNTIAIGAPNEHGTATDQNEDISREEGAAYIFSRAGSSWSQQAHLKAFNANSDYLFGHALALSADGTTLAVGSPNESGDLTGVADTTDANSGAVYIYKLIDDSWGETAYLKASNLTQGGLFGMAIDISDDGTVLVVGAPGQVAGCGAISSSDTEIDQPKNGSAYVFSDNGTAWTQQCVDVSDNYPGAEFGYSVAMAGSGNRFIVASPDRSLSSPIPEPGGRNYVFSSDNNVWEQKAAIDGRASSLAMSSNGETFVIGSYDVETDTVGISDPVIKEPNPYFIERGSVKVYRFTDQSGLEPTSIQASYSSTGWFGISVSLAKDGTLLVGASEDRSVPSGVNFGVADSEPEDFPSGAAYLY